MMSTDRLNELRAQLYGSRPEIDNARGGAANESRPILSADEYMSFLGLDELAKEIREAADLLDGLPEGRRIHEFFGS